MPVVDGSGIKSFDPIPEGTYPAILEKYENKIDSSGADLILLTFQVSEGEHEGSKQFKNQSLKPQALWNLKKVCVALGSDPESFVGEFDTDDILNEIVGNECRIKVSVQKTGDYEGRNSVDDVLAPAYSVA